MLHKPEWLRVRFSETQNREVVEQTLRRLNLNTVCKEANCPNYSECFSRKTATFMILGTNCTRKCRFCNVRNGQPQHLDPEEPKNIARAVKELELMYVVITSVARDDLPDGGAEHFSIVISEIKHAVPGVAIETLVPDFMGNIRSIETVAKASPNVISHNMETVKSLYSKVRPQADYNCSLKVLLRIKQSNQKVHSKSGIMLGFGETEEQVYELFKDLRSVGCEFLTIGQYLAPSKKHFPVQEYVHPSQFEEYGAQAKAMGFDFVASAPLVRSSYNAGEALGL